MVDAPSQDPRLQLHASALSFQGVLRSWPQHIRSWHTDISQSSVGRVCLCRTRIWSGRLSRKPVSYHSQGRSLDTGHVNGRLCCTVVVFFSWPSPSSGLPSQYSVSFSFELRTVEGKVVLLSTLHRRSKTWDEIREISVVELETR